MKASIYKFIKASQPPNIFYYPIPWVAGKPHRGKFTLCRYYDPSQVYLCGFKDIDGKAYIGLFPLDATPDTRAKYVMPLTEEAETEQPEQTAPNPLYPSLPLMSGECPINYYHIDKMHLNYEANGSIYKANSGYHCNSLSYSL